MMDRFVYYALKAYRKFAGERGPKRDERAAEFGEGNLNNLSRAITAWENEGTHEGKKKAFLGKLPIKHIVRHYIPKLDRHKLPHWLLNDLSNTAAFAIDKFTDTEHFKNWQYEEGKKMPREAYIAFRRHLDTHLYHYVMKHWVRTQTRGKPAKYPGGNVSWEKEGVNWVTDVSGTSMERRPALRFNARKKEEEEE